MWYHPSFGNQVIQICQRFSDIYFDILTTFTHCECRKQLDVCFRNQSIPPPTHTHTTHSPHSPPRPHQNFRWRCNGSYALNINCPCFFYSYKLLKYRKYNHLNETNTNLQHSFKMCVNYESSSSHIGRECLIFVQRFMKIPLTVLTW